MMNKQPDDYYERELEGHDPGTRVHHRRHTWMVGTVVEKQAEGTHVMVLWNGKGGPMVELPQDLRATPVQP